MTQPKPTAKKTSDVARCPRCGTPLVPNDEDQLHCPDCGRVPDMSGPTRGLDVELDANGHMKVTPKGQQKPHQGFVSVMFVRGVMTPRQIEDIDRALRILGWQRRVHLHNFQPDGTINGDWTFVHHGGDGES